MKKDKVKGVELIQANLNSLPDRFGNKFEYQGKENNCYIFKAGWMGLEFRFNEDICDWEELFNEKPIWEKTK